MSGLRRRPYAAALAAALGLAVGLVLLRSRSGAGGQDALLAADGGLATTTAPYGIALWLFATAAATWFGAPPVRRAGRMGGDGGIWVTGTLAGARPSAVAVAVTLGLLTPIVLMAPLADGTGSAVRWLGAMAALEVTVAAGVVLGLLTARLPVLAMPILAGTAGLAVMLAVRFTLVEIFIPDTLTDPLGGVSGAAIAGARELTAWGPLAGVVGAGAGALTAGLVRGRGRSPWWTLLGALALPLGLGLGLPLGLVATGGGAVPAAITPLEWAGTAAGGLLGAIAAAVWLTITGTGRRTDALA